MHKAGSRQVGYVVREREMWIKNYTKIANRGVGASEVKVRNELVERRRPIAESGIFLIWSGRPRMINSVLEGLRQRRFKLMTSIWRLG